MKRLAFQVALFAAITCGALHAQSINLRANIPFPFRVGQTLLAAGEYQIYNAGPALVVREEGHGHPAAMFLTRYDARLKPPAASVLKFNHYGSTYFLSEIWTAGSSEGRVIPPSREEKQLARQFGLPRGTGVAVARR